MKASAPLEGGQLLGLIACALFDGFTIPEIVAAAEWATKSRGKPPTEALTANPVEPIILWFPSTLKATV